MGQYDIVKTKQEMEHLLMEASPKLEPFLPAHSGLNYNKFMRSVIVACAKNPKILQCTKLSVLNAVQTAAELGLSCTGTLGSGHLLPFKKECVFVVGYQGLIELIYRTTKINVWAHPVYENDTFEILQGTTEKITHKPALKDAGEVIGFYAVGETPEGKIKTEWMPKKVVDKIRAKSPGRDNDTWKYHYDEMGRKTVVRRLCKYLPVSPEVEQAFAVDDVFEVQHKPVTAPPARENISVDEVLEQAPTRPEQIAIPTTEPLLSSAADAADGQRALELVELAYDDWKHKGGDLKSFSKMCTKKIGTAPEHLSASDAQELFKIVEQTAAANIKRMTKKNK